GAGNYRVALYADSASAPAARLATSTAAVTNPATGWISFTLSSAVAVVKNTNYWLAIWSDNAAAQIYADPTGGSVVDPTGSPTYGSWPNPAGTTAASASNPSYQYALYAIPLNTAPIVTIPTAPTTVTLPATASLAGASDDDGYPLIAGTPGYQWTETSGPGTVTFSAPTALATTASFSAAGTYVLRLTATDGRLSAFAEVSMDVAPGAGSNPETVIYRETFGNAGTASLPFADSSIGWKYFQAVTVGANITDTSASSSNGSADINNGRPADLTNVNAGASASAVTGYACSLNVRQSLVYTTEFPIDRSVYTPTALSWYSHISATNSGQNNQSPAVRIGGQWYVVTLSTATAGNLTQTGGGSSFNLSGSLFSFDFATATASSATGVTTTGWRTLTATPGGPFAIGTSSVALPAGNLEACGVYFTTAGAGTARFDTFEIKSTLVPLATTTTLVASSNPAAFGASVMLTATVSSSSGTPPGTVTFLDGTSNLGTGTIDGSGVATLSTSALAAGTHSLTASYTATPLYLTSTSAALAQSILHPTVTSLASNLNPSNAGASVVLTATVTSTGGTPSGTVTFLDGATTLGTGSLNGSGVATWTLSTLAAGSHSLTASYTGSATFAGGTSSAQVQTVLHPTATALTSTANPANPGAILTLTATVTSSGGTPGGAVTFSEGAATLGTGTLNGSGVATFATSALASGSHSLTASYATTTTFVGSTSNALAQTVRQPTTTVLTSSVNPAAFGARVTYTATVSSLSGTPSGTVTFLDGATVFGTATLNGSGVATLATASRPSGARSLTASYAASAGHAASTSAILIQTINAGTPVWTGEGADGLYSNPANWAGVTVPAASDTALFANNVNTAVSLSSNSIFGALQFGGDTGSFTFSPGSPGVRFIGNASGSTLTVLNTVTGAPTLTLNPDLQLSQARTSSANFAITNNSPTATLVLNGNIFGAVSTPTLSNQFSLRGSGVAYENSTIQLNGVISDGTLGGNVALTKTGGANQYSTAILTGANTYSGGTDFSAASGILALGHKTALGSGDIRLSTGVSGVIFRADTALRGVNAIANPVRYFGTLGTSVTPAPTATSTTVGGFTVTVSSTTGLAVGQVVSGTGIPLNSRITDITGPVVTISNPIAITATNFTLTASAYTNGGGGLTVLSGLNPVEFSGPVFLTTPSSNLTAATQNFRVVNSGGATFSGVLQQVSAAGVTKTGDQSLTLSAANAYTGATAVNHGVLYINGDQTAATGATTVNRTAASSSTFTSTAGTNSITAGNTSGLAPGQTVSGPGVPPGSFITSITNGTSFSISVNATALAGTGAFSFGAMTGTLGGGGSVGGAVTLGAGAFLTPGPAASTPGLLKIKSSLLLNATSHTIFDIGGISRGVNHDAVDVNGALTHGGNLILNVASTLPAASSLNLFSAGSRSGAFASVAVTGAGYGAGSLSSNGAGLWTGSVGGVQFSFDPATGSLSLPASLT
ncbi:Ig-like domain repeat protein, partial [bacterium]|nr:Ig-like domain repeat protein [bacterium]